MSSDTKSILFFDVEKANRGQLLVGLVEGPGKMYVSMLRAADIAAGTLAQLTSSHHTTSHIPLSHIDNFMSLSLCSSLQFTFALLHSLLLDVNVSVSSFVYPTLLPQCNQQLLTAI